VRLPTQRLLEVLKGFRCILSDEAYQGRLGSAGHGMGVQYQEDWSTEMQSCIGWGDTLEYFDPDDLYSEGLSVAVTRLLAALGRIFR
jgi:hypothetical protein